jgi:hypothetical protein
LPVPTKLLFGKKLILGLKPFFSKIDPLAHLSKTGQHTPQNSLGSLRLSRRSSQGPSGNRGSRGGEQMRPWRVADPEADVPFYFMIPKKVEYSINSSRGLPPRGRPDPKHRFCIAFIGFSNQLGPSNNHYPVLARLPRRPALAVLQPLPPASVSRPFSCKVVFLLPQSPPILWIFLHRGSTCPSGPGG